MRGNGGCGTNMKYIRTKDRIYDINKYYGIRTVIKIYDVDESLRLKYENTNEPQQVGDRFVIIENKDYKITDNNTANTIPELCDEFVCNEMLVYDETEMKWLVSQGCEVYGAIWTEWGLKYVAKMNLKGELELL